MAGRVAVARIDLHVCPPVLDLDDPRAEDPRLAGAKAATLARALRRGFAVLDGFVVTVSGCANRDSVLHLDAEAAIFAAWKALSGDGEIAVMVRSSSPIEDQSSSSMAGRFLSAAARGQDEFFATLDRVISSAGPGEPMAVLVQPLLHAKTGGIMFGADPVTGRRDRLIVVAAPGAPAGLAAGAAAGTRMVLTPAGRQIRRRGPRMLTRSQRLALARLAARAARRFGAPQDIEWAFDAGGGLWLLQSRPITAVASPGRGPILGPGPLAETFPDPLSILEEDLWLPPLRDAASETLALAGMSRRRIACSPVVAAVAGRLVADLDLFGARPRRGFARLDPRPGLRRLRAGWRTGRLRVQLPGRAATLVTETDRRLGAVPALATVDDDALLGLIGETRRSLAALHACEMAAGMLAGGANHTAVAASAALDALASGRAAGESDARIVMRHPVVLALSAPRVGPPGSLPAVPGDGDRHEPRSDASARRLPALREMLRLRVRWTHELAARAAWETARRLVRGGVLSDPDHARLLSVEELAAALRIRALPADLPSRRARRAGAAVPAAFRVAGDGSIVPVVTRRRRRDGTLRGTAAGGGWGTGPVHNAPGDPADGAVLVVATLDPALAPALPRLAGIVSETGTPLSHLAILAREYGVPAVVGVDGATRRLAHGIRVGVDGRRGLVTPAKEAAP